MNERSSLRGGEGRSDALSSIVEAWRRRPHGWLMTTLGVTMAAFGLSAALVDWKVRPALVLELRAELEQALEENRAGVPARRLIESGGHDGDADAPGVYMERYRLAEFTAVEQRQSAWVPGSKYVTAVERFYCPRCGEAHGVLPDGEVLECSVCSLVMEREGAWLRIREGASAGDSP